MSRLILMAGAAALLVLLLLGTWLADPFGRRDRLRRAEHAAAATATARALEAEGARESAERVAASARILSETRAATAAAVVLARRAEDASEPLDPDRGARLREHDRRLCERVPASCGPAASDPAVGGD